MNSVILGESVTKFAKSPKIWNYLYEYFQIPSRMVPIDTTSENLPETIERVRNQVDFGLISSPLKAHPHWKKFKCSDYVALSDSANFFRIEKDGELYLENFDGAAAVDSLAEICEAPWQRRTLIMGTGPLGRTVASSLILKNHLSIPDITFVTKSKREKLQEYKLFNRYEFNFIEKSDISNFEFDVIINCTPIGSPRSPGSLLSNDDFRNFDKACIYFDVNYGELSPSGVEIAKKSGLRALDGARMNLIQATDAFRFANNLEMQREELMPLIEKSNVLRK